MKNIIKKSFVCAFAALATLVASATITVDTTKLALPDGAVGESYLSYGPGWLYFESIPSYNTFSGGTAPYTIAVKEGTTKTLPPGMSFYNSSNVNGLSGTPTTPGYYEIEVTITDANNETVEAIYTITIITPPFVVNDSKLTLASGEVGKYYYTYLFGDSDYQKTFSGGVPPYTVVVKDGTDKTLPLGLSILGSGTSSIRISGYPTTAGSYETELTVSDSGDVTTNIVYSITIDEPALEVVAGKTTLDSITQHISASINLAGSVTGGTAPYSYVVKDVDGNNLPTGLSLSNSGVISGTPTVAGEFSFIVTVSDSATTPPIDVTYSLSIVAPDPITAATSLTATVGNEKSFTLADTISGGVPPYTFALKSGSNAPNGFTLVDGVLSGTAAAAVDSYSFTVIVTDAIETAQEITYTFSASEYAGFTDDDPEEPASGVSVACRTADGVMRQRTCHQLTSSDTTWSDSWYYVTGEVSIPSVVVNGKVSLILGDGATLTVQGASSKAGIRVAVEGSVTNSLTIYCQGAGTGTLVAKGGSAGAGIGGDNKTSGGTGIGDCGKVTIYGGVIEATGSGDAAGIGGGDWRGNGGTVAVYGGTVTATAGSSSAAGVGMGWNGNNGTLTVGERILVKAGSSANPTTVLDHGDAGAITLSGQRYFTFETTGPEPLTQTVNALAAYVGQAFNRTLSATVSGGTPSYTFVQKSGTLPTGLSFENGTISGTPTVGGSATVVFTVTDSGVGADNQSEDFSYTITVTYPPKSITYIDSRDGTTELTELVPAEYAPGVGATLPATATAPNGYTFAGWYPNAGCTGDAVTTVGTEATENLTFYAKWTPIVYTVTYNDGDTPITDQGLTPTSYTIESATLTLPASATKEGKGFYGWYDNSGCTGSAVTTIPSGSTGNKTFWAKWGAVKVSADYVDAAGVSHSAECAQITSDMTTLDTGWYVVIGEVATSGKVSISGNVNLVLADGATWTVASSVSGGAIDLKGENSLAIYGQENGSGALIVTKNSSGPAIGSGDSYNPCGTLTINGGIITANGCTENSAGIGGGWGVPGGTVVINGGTVTSNGGWGSAGIGGGGTANGGTVTINGGRVIANGGESGGAGIGGGRSATSQGTLTVGAKVVVKAGASANPDTVLERGAGGAITLNGQQYFTSETLVLAQAETEIAAYAGEAFELSLAATISGGVPTYSFSGLTPNNLGLTLTSGGLLSGTLAADVYNLTLTVTDSELDSINASYTLTVSNRPKTITYKDGENTINGLSPAQYTPGTATTLAASATKTGYMFDGWYTNVELAGDPVTTVSASETENKTYWAKWTPVAYSIVYMDGTTPMDGLTPTTYTIEAAATLPENATKAGYGFYGWFVDSSCTGSAVTTIPAGQTGNKTFYAKWGVIKVPANYVDENGDPQTAQCVEIDSSTTSLETGWYVVNGEVSIDTSVTVSGAVNLILADGSHLEVTVASGYSSGLNVASGNSLTIFAQSGGTGRLDATGASSISSGIGGDSGQACGEVTINGGTIVARGGSGIGGGYQQAGGTVKINGGVVTATGTGGAGIGGGAGTPAGAGGTVTINGGTVTATGGYSGAGIGGGSSGVDQGTLTVGANIVVKAGSSANPETVLDHGIGGVITLGGQRYFTTEVSGPVPLNQTSAALAAYAGEAFELALTGTISGGVPAYTFSGLTPDNLGLTLTTEGTLSGMLAADVYNLTLTVTDSELDSINASYTLTVSNRPKTITYKDGDATINGLSPAQYTPGTATALAASATKTGYTFAGWYDNAGLDGEAVTTTGTEATEDLTFWAKWTAVNYAITYYEDSTTPMAGLVPTTYTIEAAVSLPATATKTGGYAFLGWYSNSSLTGDAVTEIPAGQTGAKSFYAKWGEASVNANYIDENGDGQSAECTVITPSTTTLNAGWYVVNSDVSISQMLTVSGEVNIILADGARLAVTGDQYQPGIKVAGDNTLRIYGQSEGTGRLEATGQSICAGIGGGNNETCGTVIVNGGVVVASGGTGIGGGFGGAGGTVTINGGTVEATGNSQAGIGGGYNGAGGTVTINGGTVVAVSYSAGAGIGGGTNGAGGTVTIEGGTVTATGGVNAAGIGGGQNAAEQGSLTVGENIIVKAGASANPTAELEHGAGGAITLSGETYFKVETQTLLAQATAALAATDGSAFELALADTISGGRAPYTFAGTEPGELGLTLTSNGTLSGTLAVGEYNFTVTVTDTESTAIEASYTLTVSYAPRRITYCIGINPISGHNPSTYTPGVGATLLPYEREGYTFNGWYTDMDLQEGPVTSISTEETTDKIFYGKWTANTSGVPVTFIDADGSERTETCEVLTTETTTLADGGWYVVNTALNYGMYNGLTVSGTANLVIADGASLTVQGAVNKAGIAVYSGNSLNIFAQSEGTGAINATGCFGAGIGGDLTDASCGTIAINGGNVTAIGDTASGIGGGNNGAAGTVTINRATVVATGGNSGAGIGGGNHGAGGSVTINNSTVTATGGDMAAGIGGGTGAAGGDVIVNSGSVTATGGNMACGIGAGAGNYTYGTLKIGPALAAKAGASADPVTEFYADENGYVTFGNTYRYCTVTASGATPYIDVDGTEKAVRCKVIAPDTYGYVTLDEEWYCIEGELAVTRGITVSGDVKIILVDGASLTVTQSSFSKAGITVAAGNSLTIYGQSGQNGVLNITGYTNGAGIGGNNNTACGTITINGGVVTAQGGESGAGIGGGNTGAGGTVVVNRGTVTVTGGSGGAGIGGGYNGAGGTLTINGGTVTATGGEFASAVGGAVSGNGGTVTVNGGTLIANGGASGGTAIGKGMAGSDNGSLTVAAQMLIKTGTAQDSLAIVNPTVEAETLTPDGKRYCTITPAEIYAIAYVDDDDTTLLEGLEPSQYVAGVGATLPETAVKSGCTLDGWYATAARTGEPVTEIPADATGPQVVYAKWIYATTVSYVDASGESHQGLCQQITTDGERELASGWYYVEGEVTLDTSLVVNGDVTLILSDDAKLTVQGAESKAGINVTAGNSLTIYAQAAGTGKLFATGGNYGAGIGGDDSYGGVANCGTVTINGGFVVAKGNKAAGIGGGDGGSGGTVTINGGVVLATGSSSPYTVPGIGAGHNGANMGTLTVADGVSVGAGRYLVAHDESIAKKTPVNGVVELAANAVYYEFEQTSVAESYGYVEFSSEEPFSMSATKRWDNILKYSTDVGPWNYWFGEQIDAVLSHGRYRIYFRGIGNTKLSSEDSSWVITGSNVACTGNIDAIRDYAGIATMASSAYYDMFKGCSALASAPTLPATNLTQNCYRRMFYGCTSLVTPPALPATVLAANCYQEMFSGCTSLNTLPVLPATTLANHCYYQMFEGCSSIMIYYSGEGIEWSIPSTAVAQPNWNLWMFHGTTGDFTTNGPEIGVTYIVLNPVATEYSITYWDGNVELTGLIPATYLTGEGATLPTAATVTKEGWLFTGWHMLSDCSDPAVTTIAANATGYKEFYASWEEVFEPEFTIVDGKLTAVDLHGNTEIIIPDDVYDIDSLVFRNCTYLESVMIPTTVTNIGYWAFAGCTALTEVTIPGSVESIGKFAFDGCTSLTNLTLVEGVKYIDEEAFWGCSSLTNGVDGLYFPDSIVSISHDAFYSCGSLTKVSLPGSMYEFGGPVNPGFDFHRTEVIYRTSEPMLYIWNGYLRSVNLNGHTEIVIPETVEEIGPTAFKGLAELESVTIPSSVTNITSGAFEDCTGLSSVTMNDGLLSMGMGVFDGCTSLTQVTIPDSVTSLESGMFDGCTSLEEVTIGSGVTVIPHMCFKDCHSLTNIIFKGDVTTIDYYAFWNCRALSELTLPDSLTRIAHWVFDGCTSLTAIAIPRDVEIDSFAFEGCTNLETVSIDKGCTLNAWAFSGCPGLKSVNISGTVVSPKKRLLAAAGGRRLLAAAGPDPDATSVGDYAFYGCSGLESALIGSKVTEIGGGAFGGCSKLKSITVEAGNENYTTVDGMLLTADYTTLISGAGADKGVTIPDGVTKIEEGAFAGFGNITSVTLPDTVTSIGEAAFSNCTALATVTIPSSVTSIGSKAFYGTKLKTVSLLSSSYAETMRGRITGSGYDTTKVVFIAPTDSINTAGMSEDVAATLLEPADNGLPNWQNYVLGQDSDEPVKVEGVSAATETSVSIASTLKTPTAGTGFTVKYSIDQVSSSGEVVAEGAKQSSTSFSIDLGSITTNAFFKMKATLSNDDVEVPVETENVIGVLAITDAPKTTIIGVPFKSLSDDGSIAVADLVHTANLSDGAQLSAFDSSGNLHSWTLEDGEWTADAVIGQQEQTGDADTIKLDRGKGVWLTRADEDLDKPIYLIGEASNESVETTLEAPDNENETAWTLVASPSVEPADVADIVGENTNDRIILPVDGFPRNYSCKNGEWGYDGIGSEVTTNKWGDVIVTPIRINDTKIPAGRGFWYLNKNAGSKSINW